MCSVPKTAGTTMRLRTLAAGSMLVLLAVGPLRAECRGTDLFPQLQETDPVGFAELADAARSLPHGRGKLFRVSKDGVKPSYLFGTLHISDPRVTALSPGVRRALESADVVALEVTEMKKAIKELGPQALAFKEAKADEGSDRLLTPEQMADLEEAVAAHGLPVSAARSFKPAFLAMLLSDPPCAADPAEKRPDLDTLVGQLAQKRSIPVVGLESMLEQLQAMFDVAPEVQRDLLLAVLQKRRNGEDAFTTRIVRYVEGDLGSLLALMQREAPLGGLEFGWPRVFVEQLIDKRNRRMRDRALPLLAKGGAFIAVGALHLPGEQGLARLLEQAGYKVEAVE